jgi:murein DD-endopeptidase MepM/ murein hydrolase activator NlpD
MKLSPRAALAAFFLSLCATSPGIAQSASTAEATIEEHRLLGSADEEARERELLPFTRSFGASGLVAGSLAESAAAARVPPAAMIEALRAFDREPEDGEAFYVRWEQAYSVDGHPIGIGKVLWAELRTEAGATIAIHRFRPSQGPETFWRSSGAAATPPAIALPLDDLTVSSRFGIRPDPLARSASSGASTVASVGGPQPDLHGAAATLRAPRYFAGFLPRLFMHEGVDFAVPPGTPIYAAAHGVVSGARPNGGYGNWIRIDHADGVATAYGHLSRFARGIKPGVSVVRGELVGFSGNTGRSTGPHLHFEVLTDGKPVDPLAHAAPAQLSGADLERFARKVAADQRDRANEAPAAE